MLADGTNAIAYCFDKNGNLTADGQYIYRYDVENRLRQMREQVNTDCANLDLTGAWKAGFGYDPLGRLYKINEGLNSTRLLHDGDALVAEYRDGDNVMLRRYVHGANAAADDPLVWYEGAGVARADRRYLYADARGSIVLVADAEGNTQAINAYDEYGIPTTDNGGFDITTRGRFRYTGQLWLPELGMYYYKARVYSPALGRFMQVDPIGYEDQFNLYAYVGNDPVNAVDPTGLCETRTGSRICEKTREVTFAVKSGDAISIYRQTVSTRDGFVFRTEKWATEGVGESFSPLELLPAAKLGKIAGEGISLLGAGLRRLLGQTEHGAARAAGAAANGVVRGGALSRSESIATRMFSTRTLQQADGANVFIRQLSSGKFNVVVSGERGVITSFRTISQKSLDRLAKNYGWKP